MSFTDTIKPVIINRKTIAPLPNAPKHLRKYENYKPIQKKLFNILSSTHSHGDILDWFTCFPCMQRFKKYQEEKAKLGFRSSDEFMKWEKVNNDHLKNEH